MREYFPPETSADYAHPEYFDKLLKNNVYKDTHFVIYKESIGKHWSALLLCEDGKHFYKLFSARTKRNLIKLIESDEIYNDLKADYEELGKLIEVFKNIKDEKRNRNIG